MVLLAIGTCGYGKPEPTQNMHLAEFSPESSELKNLLTVETGPNPAAVWWCKDRKIMVVALEVDGKGGVATYSVEGSTVKLINTVDVGPSGPCYLETTEDGKWILAACYGSGQIVSLPLLDDGKVGEIADRMEFKLPEGDRPGISELRQEAAHCHMIRLDQAGRVLVPDLGADRMWVLTFDQATGKFGNHPEIPHYVAAPGSGPRHLDISRDGKVIYLLNELTSVVDVLEFGSLKCLQQLNLLPDDLLCTDAHHLGSASILTSSDGKRLYISNRSIGRSFLAICEIGEAGALSLRERVPTGECPRHFAIWDRPEGEDILVGNQMDGTVTLLRGLSAAAPPEGRPPAVALSVPSPDPIPTNLAFLC